MAESGGTRKTSPSGRRAGKVSNNGNDATQQGNALIDWLVSALENEVGRNETAASASTPNHNAIVIIQPSENGIVLYCPNKEAACANLKLLARSGQQQVEVCHQLHAQISESLLDSSIVDLPSAKRIKHRVKTRIKTLLNDEPEKSYRKKVRNGKEYWYEVWWDPVEKKKKDRYVPLKDVPAHLRDGDQE